MRKKFFAAVLAMLMLTGCANTAGDKAEKTMTETTSVSQALPDEVEVEVCEEDNDDEFTDSLEDVIFEDDEEEFDPYPEDELLENGNEDISQFLEATASTSAPAKVKLKKAYTAQKTSVTISWSKIKNAKGYRVQIYNSSKKVWKNLKTITKNSTVSYKVTGLKAGTKYKLRVKAYTKASGKTVWGKASAAKNVVTKAKAVTLKAANITEKSVKFSWAKVKCHGYKLQQYTNKTWKTIKTLKNTATSVTVSDLKSNTSYKYRIVSYVTDSSKNKTWNTNSSACSITTKPTTTKQTTTTKATTTTTAKQTTKQTTTTTAKQTTKATTTTTKSTEATTEKEVHVCDWRTAIPVYKDVVVPAWDETVKKREYSNECHGCKLKEYYVEEAWNNKDEATLKKLILTNVTDKKVIKNVNEINLLEYCSGWHDLFTTHCDICGDRGYGWTSSSVEVEQVIHHEETTKSEVDYYICSECGKRL